MTTFLKDMERQFEQREDLTDEEKAALLRRFYRGKKGWAGAGLADLNEGVGAMLLAAFAEGYKMGKDVAGAK